MGSVYVKGCVCVFVHFPLFYGLLRYLPYSELLRLRRSHFFLPYKTTQGFIVNPPQLSGSGPYLSYFGLFVFYFSLYVMAVLPPHFPPPPFLSQHAQRLPHLAGFNQRPTSPTLLYFSSPQTGLLPPPQLCFPLFF